MLFSKILTDSYRLYDDHCRLTIHNGVLYSNRSAKICNIKFLGNHNIVVVYL